MRNYFIVTKEDIKNLIVNPMWVLYETVFPILLVAILGNLTKDNYGKSVTSYHYYIITILLYSILSSATIAANAFMEKSNRSANMRIIFSPSDVRVIYISKIAATFVFCFACHVIDFLLIILCADIQFERVFQLIMLFAFSDIFFSGMGVMFCSIFKSEAVANQILTIALNISAVLGGLFFSLDGYGKVIQTVSWISPAKWIRNYVFSILYDGETTSLFIVLGVIIIAIVMEIFVCEKLFKAEDCV